MIPVTVVTKNATQDNLTPEDYRDIYRELRQHDESTSRYAISLDKFVEMIASQFSKALWNQYERGEKELNRGQRNELRQAVGLGLLPLTVQDAVIPNTIPDAEVIYVGTNGQAYRVVLLGTDEPIVLSVNGSVNVHSSDEVDAVTPVTRAARPHKRVVRPLASHEQNNQRVELGVSWKEVISAGLDALTNQKGMES